MLKNLGIGFMVWTMVAVVLHAYFGYQFIYNHIPSVGWEQVLSNWHLYALSYICGWCLFLGCFMLSKIIQLIFKEDEDHYVW